MVNMVNKHQKDIFLSFCIVLVSIISFNLGKINALEKTPLKITDNKTDNFQATISKTQTANNKQTSTPKPKPQNLDTRVVASKNSNKYHFTWCPGAQQIKEVNKIWFENESLAQKTGLTIAGNCN